MRGNVVELRTPQGRENLDQLLEEVTIRCPEDIHDAAVAMARIAEERGLQIAMCDDISSKEPMMDAEGTILNADIFKWLDDDARWWEDHRLALHSPMPRACRYESEPFWVNEQGFNTRWRNSYLSANSFVPLDRTKIDLSEEFAEYGSLFSQLTRRFIAGYVQANRTKRRIPSDCVLSKREVECLRWAAIGKTDKEISMILERSHATIRYHVHRAGEKLDSVNRAQTIFKAGQLGYLGASS